MKAIIVEDEIPAKEELEYLIQTHSNMEIVASFEDGLDVLKFLQAEEVDAIFLDINLKAEAARSESPSKRRPNLVSFFIQITFIR